ncbi:sphingomyelin phosphodiesterase 4 isoform X2 [Copidosoma floridanum]|uniref:sphingomyelin phosphodiesterase 4 isoform X2 n=1 Tax=Copidosoma floridanum TaxID=29053 RepID=UPI0006C9B877|nr:sphingomyelin phosphodiesterase 4 isoform X2 [Copidosoma floridanum]
MANMIDMITGRVQHYLTLPMVQRCSELTTLINELSTNELQHIFPMLINSIFGLSGDNVGWSLHTLTLKKNPLDYEILLSFLSPMGPMFSLVYKLLPDCYLKYNFSVSYLPAKIRLMLEEGIIPPFYLDKLKDDGIRPCAVLCMNPFEYYIFHFVFHLTNPWLQVPPQESIFSSYDTVYFELANRYLCHFLPKDNSPVLPIIGPYIKKTSSRKLMQSPDVKRMQTTRLLKATIVNPNSMSPESGVPQQQQCLSQVWRSETLVQVILDFWLEFTEDEHFSLNSSLSVHGNLPRKSCKYTAEHMRLIRQFIKILYKFTNSFISDGSAMDELKRVILPSVQGKIYTFLSKTMQHWPLDGSFINILEVWLSFIQPWRYVPAISYLKQGQTIREDRRATTIRDPVDWISFVAQNLLAYTAIFQQLLQRFMRLDLVAPKNAKQLFRVTKVFSQPHLANMLRDVENCIDEVASMRNRSTNQWTGMIRQQIHDLEGPSYQYVPMFSQATVSQVICFLNMINQAYSTSVSLVDALEKQRVNKGFLSSICEFLGIESKSVNDVSLETRREVPDYLASVRIQLIEIFEIDENAIPHVPAVADQEYHESVLQTSHHHPSTLDSSFNSKRPGVFVPVPDSRQSCRYIEYMGDPELQPVCSYEIAFLVRLFYKLSNYLNTKYRQQLTETYNRETFLGRVTRQILQPPTTVVQLPKRTSQGFSSGYEKRLPPHVSLRSAASYHFLVYLAIGMSVFWMLSFGTTQYLAFLLSLWTFIVLFKAVTEPWRTRCTTDFSHRVSFSTSFY